ncbi:MAG: 2-dehydro-3-deoxy-6-phosphogalactonate aldolase [Pseudomonadota bacterium]
MTEWAEAFADMPLVAILRGIETGEVDGIVGASVESGFRIIEIPLNSPNALDSIALAADRYADRAMIGAGTVLTAHAVEQVQEAGGRLIVAPNLNDEVAKAAVHHRLIYCPGVMTPTEAFRALDLSADALKLFPAELIPPAGVKAMAAVLPSSAAMLAVGGVTPDKLAVYLEAGAAGFGLGSALYRPGDGPEAVGKAATAFVEAFRSYQDSDGREPAP